MGISDLRPALPWIYIKDYLSAFPLHTLLFDAANILFWCALHHAVEFEKGNYLPAVKDFQHYLQYLVSRNTKMHMFFDGKPNNAKMPEDQRRGEKRASAQQKVAQARAAGTEPDLKDLKALVHNTSSYIAMCVCCCQDLQVPCTVCYQEADAGLAAAAKAGNNVVVSFDSDMLALGVSKLLYVTSWIGGSATFIDLEASYDGSSGDESGDESEEYPLVRHYLKHGHIVFQMWAAALGCDFSTEECGIRSVGKVTLLQIFDDIFDRNEMKICDVVSQIMTLTTGHDADLLTAELHTVVCAFTDAYTEACYCGRNCTIGALAGPLINPALRRSVGG